MIGCSYVAVPNMAMHYSIIMLGKCSVNITELDMVLLMYYTYNKSTMHVVRVCPTLATLKRVKDSVREYEQSLLKLATASNSVQ
jgi:hypothetical protein